VGRWKCKRNWKSLGKYNKLAN